MALANAFTRVVAVLRHTLCMVLSIHSSTLPPSHACTLLHMLSAAFTHTLFDATLCAEGSWLLQMLPMEMFGKTSNYSNYHNEPVSPRGLPAAVQVHGGYANSIERHYTRIGAAAAAGTAGILLCVVLCCVCLVCVLCVLCVFVRCVVCCVLFILSILSHEESHARLFTP